MASGSDSATMPKGAPEKAPHVVSPKRVSQSSTYFEYPEFPFVRPPELDGRKVRHKVALVGGGPVAMSLALELKRHGVDSVIIEADATVADGSRAVCISRRSMEFLQQIGVDERFREKALDWTRGRSFYRGATVFELEMPHSEDERFYPMCNLQQCYIEAFLAAALVEQGGEIRWQSRVTGVEASDDGVVLQVDTPEGAYALEADWVVATDGARSTMRKLMNLKLEGVSFEGRYLIADIKLESDHPIERRAWFDPPSNPGSTVLMHKQPDDIWRIDYQLRDDQDEEEEMREERIRERIQKQLDMVGETGAWELDWYSLYKAHTLSLPKYRYGRVLFAGDAAHLVPIFGVRGLNSGFADAGNLGWKLAYVVRGLSDTALLDTYSDERHEACLDIIRNARKSTIFMTPPSRGYELMRDAALSLAISNEFTRPLVNPRQSAPYDYTESPLNTVSDRGADDKAFDNGPRVGGPMQSVLLEAGEGNAPCYLVDYQGAGFTLLYFADEQAPDAVRAAVAGQPVPCRLLTVARRSSGVREDKAETLIGDPAGRVAAIYGAVPGTAYLIRPDGHVAARWKHLEPAQVPPALARAAALSTQEG